MSDGLALPIPPAFVQAVARLVAPLVLPLVREQLAGDPDATPWMDTRAAAKYLAYEYETFRKMASRREVPCRKEGTLLFFHRDELDSWRLERSQPKRRAA